MGIELGGKYSILDKNCECCASGFKSQKNFQDLCIPEGFVRLLEF